MKTNTIYEGDCLNIMEDFPDKSIDMILCDLPYGTTVNNWDRTIPIQKLWHHYERIIKDNGVIALTSHQAFTANLIESNLKLFKYKMIWIKSKPTNFLNAKKQPLRKHEDICIFYRKQPEYNPIMTNGKAYDKGIRSNKLTVSYGDYKPSHSMSTGNRYPTDVFYAKTAESEPCEIIHATQKPVNLGRYLIRLFTKENDIVLDNCSGSGSFLVAAKLENRQFIGIEKNIDMKTLKNKRQVNLIEESKKRLETCLKDYPDNTNKKKPNDLILNIDTLF